MKNTVELIQIINNQQKEIFRLKNLILQLDRNLKNLAKKNAPPKHNQSREIYRRNFL